MANETVSSSGVSPTAIGEELKKARQKKQLSLTQVQSQTRIYSTIVSALEEGRSQELLPPVYVKSFLKKYSDFLGLDGADIVKRYSALLSEAPHRTIAETRRIYADRSDIIIRIIYGIGIALILGALILFTASLIKKTSASAKATRGPAQKAAVTRTSKKAQKGAASVTQKTSSRQASVPTARVPSALERPAENKNLPSQKAPFRLEIRVKKTVLVKAEADGQVLFERVLTKGMAETIKVKDKAILSVASGDSVELLVDGKSQGAPGRGVLKHVEITRDGIMRVR